MSLKNRLSLADLQNAFRNGVIFNNFVVDSEETKILEHFPGFPRKCKKTVFLINSHKKFSVVVDIKYDQLKIQVFNYDKPEEFFQKDDKGFKKVFSKNSIRQNKPYIMELNIKSSDDFDKKSFWLDIQIPPRELSVCSLVINIFLDKLKPFLV